MLGGVRNGEDVLICWSGEAENVVEIRLPRISNFLPSVFQNPAYLDELLLGVIDDWNHCWIRYGDFIGTDSKYTTCEWTCIKSYSARSTVK
jgi:hypothetical protein